VSASLASYARRVAAPLERVWENVLDWEHLPHLHRESFCGIDLEQAGASGWRARVRIPPRERPAELRIEVSIEREAGVYHTRTLTGPGAGTEIVTTLAVPDAAHTDVRVEFRVPGVREDAAQAVGAGYVRLYTRLWDQDEAMMVRREALRAGRAPGPPRPGPRPPLALGPVSALRARLPLVVDLAGDRFRVLEHAGRLLAHAAVCPHLGGPLEDAALEAGAVVCPWHGYRFDCASGRGPEGQRCRMPVRASLEVDARGDAHLVVT
jgi:nitrite reductase/ring-hydroxylating ferredoxin subunit